ncbi:hypothetical protein RJ035_007624 [Blastomyces gilchristii]
MPQIRKNLPVFYPRTSGLSEGSACTTDDEAFTDRSYPRLRYHTECAFRCDDWSGTRHGATVEPGFSWLGPENFSFLDNISPYSNFCTPRNENSLNSVVSNVGGALFSPSSSTSIRNYEQKGTQVTVTSPIQQLASLSVAMYEYASNLPSRCEARAGKPTRFVFEDLFHLTLELM